MEIKPDSFEKLGVFYLGREYDLDHGQPRDKLLLYDSKDLLTHAVCVGMTGSGKTGLCLTLLEEAAIDGIPAIVIDPKGDLTNLLLTFPHSRPRIFSRGCTRITPAAESLDRGAREAAGRACGNGGSPNGVRTATASRGWWRAADFAIYTPGSIAGRRVSVLQAFGRRPHRSATTPTCSASG